jgi:hypothetical protein
MNLQIQRAGLEFVGDDDIRRGRQSWTREATVTWSGHKIRVHIERDSYDFQSRIYSEVFNPRELKWNRLQTLSGSDHGYLPSYVVKDDVAIFRETNDLLNALIAYAQQVLDGVPA